MDSICVLRLTRYKKIRLEMDACHKWNYGSVVSAFICRGKFQVRFLRPHFFFLWLFGLHKIFIARGLRKPRFGALVGAVYSCLGDPGSSPQLRLYFFELKHGIYMYKRLNTWLLVASILVA